MTTYAYTLTLNDTEHITLNRVLHHIVTSFDYQSLEESATLMPIDLDNCRHIKKKLLEAETELTSTNSFDGWQK